MRQIVLIAGVLVLVTGIMEFGSAHPAGADPGRPDLVITPAATFDVIEGTPVNLGFSVSNVGTEPSAGIIVTIQLPDTLRPDSTVAFGKEWDCFSHTPPGWMCEHTGLNAGERAGPLVLTATVISGVPGELQTITANVTTSSRERSLDNNHAEEHLNYVTPGTIHGVAWNDQNQDGQRQSGEPLLPRATIFILLTQAGGIGSIRTTIGDGGEYSVPVIPGTHRVSLAIGSGTLTAPNVGDDATDSDVIPAGFPTEGNGEIAVGTGGVAAFDIGIVLNG